MRSIEWELRAFRAAFWISPGFANWVRTRGRELRKSGEDFEIILCWGRFRFRLANAPDGEPYFAIRRADGTLERSPWV
jgi:hypothetical protein